MRKWLVSILAVPAALMSVAAVTQMAAAAQVAPDRTPRPVATDEPKYQVYVGGSYTSLNQVNQSRYGLAGVNADVSRNFGRFFAVFLDGAYFPASVGSGNPGNPKVSMGFGGVELHGPIFENWNVFGRGMLGGEHTGGEAMTPNISFAGGLGGGVEHTMGRRWALRVSGDDIGASFSLRNNNPQLGLSSHKTWNARAGIGIVFRF
jgi:hypothetical protein